jgi:hypothetical protein
MLGRPSSLTLHSRHDPYRWGLHARHTRASTTTMRPPFTRPSSAAWPAPCGRPVAATAPQHSARSAPRCCWRTAHAWSRPPSQAPTGSPPSRVSRSALCTASATISCTKQTAGGCMWPRWGDGTSTSTASPMQSHTTRCPTRSGISRYWGMSHGCSIWWTAPRTARGWRCTGRCSAAPATYWTSSSCGACPAAAAAAATGSLAAPHTAPRPAAPHAPHPRYCCASASRGLLAACPPLGSDLI